MRMENPDGKRLFEAYYDFIETKLAKYVALNTPGGRGGLPPRNRAFASRRPQRLALHKTNRTNSSDAIEEQEYENNLQFETNSSQAIDKQEYENNHQFETNLSDAIRNVTELLEDLSFVQDELKEDQYEELPHVYIWIGVSAVASVCIVAIITIITIKVRRIRTKKKQANIDTNPEDGDGDYEYYRQTELCDSNEAYYQN